MRSLPWCARLHPSRHAPQSLKYVIGPATGNVIGRSSWSPTSTNGPGGATPGSTSSSPAVGGVGAVVEVGAVAVAGGAVVVVVRGRSVVGSSVLGGVVVVVVVAAGTVVVVGRATVVVLWSRSVGVVGGGRRGRGSHRRGGRRRGGRRRDVVVVVGTLDSSGTSGDAPADAGRHATAGITTANARSATSRLTGPRSPTSTDSASIPGANDPPPAVRSATTARSPPADR